MFWPLDFWLLVVLIVAAIVALQARDLLAAITSLVVYSFVTALLFAQLGAIDVSFVEASLGAAFSGILFILALYFTKRRSED